MRAMFQDTEKYWKKITLFISGRVATTSGYGILIVIVSWYVYSVSHSIIFVMLLGLVEMIPTFTIGLFSGYVADNYDNLKIMLLTDLVRFSIITSITIYLLFYGFSFVPVLIMVGSEGLLGALFRPISMSYIPQITKEEHIQRVNGFLNFGGTLASTTSFFVGGVILISIGAIVGLIFDSLSYLYSVITLFLIYTFMHYPIKSKEQKSVKKGLTNPISGVKEGWNVLLKTPGIFWLSISTTGFQFFYSMAGMYIVVYISSFLGGSGLVYGMVLCIAGASSAIGSLLPAKVRIMGQSGIFIIISFIAIGISFFILGLSHLLYIDYALFCTAGIFFGISITIFSSVLQTNIEETYIGRVFAVDELMTYIGIPAGQIVGGLLITIFGISEIYSLSGLGMLVIGSLMFLLPQVKAIKIPQMKK